MSKKGFNHLFIDALREIFSAENQILQVMPVMIEASDSEELKEALTLHLANTQKQIERLNQIFQHLEINGEGEICEAMKGLVQETNHFLAHYEHSFVRDSAIILASQRIEHYQIAVYETLLTFAQHLDLGKIAGLLKESLEEESDANKQLKKIAEGGFFTAGVNQRAIEE